MLTDKLVQCKYSRYRYSYSWHKKWYNTTTTLCHKCSIQVDNDYLIKTIQYEHNIKTRLGRVDEN
jgi:hypothetical protein